MTTTTLTLPNIQPGASPQKPQKRKFGTSEGGNGPGNKQEGGGKKRMENIMGEKNILTPEDLEYQEEEGWRQTH